MCAYVHSLKLSDAEWTSGAEYRLWLGTPHTLRVERTADERLHPFGAEARENGSTWDRAGKMLGTSATARQSPIGRRYSQPSSV